MAERPPPGSPPSILPLSAASLVSAPARLCWDVAHRSAGSWATGIRRPAAGAAWSPTLTSLQPASTLRDRLAGTAHCGSRLSLCIAPRLLRGQARCPPWRTPPQAPSLLPAVTTPLDGGRNEEQLLPTRSPLRPAFAGRRAWPPSAAQPRHFARIGWTRAVPRCTSTFAFSTPTWLHGTVISYLVVGVNMSFHLC